MRRGEGGLCRGLPDRSLTGVGVGGEDADVRERERERVKK